MGHVSSVESSDVIVENLAVLAGKVSESDAGYVASLFGTAVDDSAGKVDEFIGQAESDFEPRTLRKRIVGFQLQPVAAHVKGTSHRISAGVIPALVEYEIVEQVDCVVADMLSFLGHLLTLS